MYNEDKMKRISMILFAICFMALTLALLSGCRVEECQKMARCCNAIEEHEGVGGACGGIAEGLKDPDSCRSVLRAVDAMFEQRDEDLPAACQ
jgi:uncharacterized protein with PQ loop repeat